MSPRKFQHGLLVVIISLAIFVAVLEQQLSQSRPVEVINFGTGNYNTEQKVNLFLTEPRRDAL